MSDVSAILQQLAENAGRAQLARGNTYASLVQGIANVPGQIKEDREKQAGIDLQRARDRAQLVYAQHADTRATADQAYQDQQRALALEHQRVVNAGLTAAMGSNGDPTTFDAGAAWRAVSALGRPDAITDVIATHQAMRGKPIVMKTDETGYDPNTYQPIPGLVGPEKTPEIGTPAYEVYARRLDLLKNGPPATAAPTPGAPPLTPAQATAQAYADQRTAVEAAKPTPPNEFQAFKTAYPATVRPGATWETLTPQEQTDALTKYSQRSRDPDAAAQLGVLRGLTVDLARQRLTDAQRTSTPTAVVVTRPDAATGNAVDPATGLTANALFQAGMSHALEGKFPPVGMGQSKASMNIRTAVQNTSAAMANEAGVDIPELRAEYRANATALNKLIPAAAFTASSAGAAQDNLDLALGQSDQVARGGAKLVNRYTNWVKGELTPAAGLTQFETYIYTAAREYAKVVSGSAQSVAGLSDTAAKEAERLLNAAQSPEAFAAAATAMKNDMGNVTANQRKAISAVSSTIGNFLNAVNRTGGAPGGGANVSGGGLVTVRDPLGGVHSFTTQADADTFKRAAGIK